MHLAPHRIPAGDELEPLMRWYGYRLARTGTVRGTERSGDPTDLAAARAAGWPADRPERWSAREVVGRAVAAVAALDEDAVLAAFVAGLGNAPRGRRPVISYGWARHLDTAPRGREGIPGLAEYGVLPRPALPPMWDRFIPAVEAHAASQTLRGAPRADITVPLAGWRGGLDEQRARPLLEL